MRCWHLTWTTYGSWLPGDERGFVSNVAEKNGHGVRHNRPGTPCDADLPALAAWMQKQLRGSPVRLDADDAAVLLQQFQQTANIRGWRLLAVAIMANHIHTLVQVPGDPEPSDLLRDLKSYGSRALNRRHQQPPSTPWWTESGSKRKKSTAREVCHCIEYIRQQPHALLIFINNDQALRFHGERGA